MRYGYSMERGPPLYSVHRNRSPSKGNGCDPQCTNDYMSHQSPSQWSNPDGPGGETTSTSRAPRRHNDTEWQPPSQTGRDQFRIHGPPNPTAISKGGNCWGINSPWRWRLCKSGVCAQDRGRVMVPPLMEPSMIPRRRY
jgi:hypothetical protein